LLPIRFGASSRQLFGLYQEPFPQSARGEGILLCNPFGQEAIRSHRLFKVLADRLCRDGFHVLRFDYFGTGDSAGSDDEVSVAGFVADLKLADGELLSRSGCARRTWVGLRLGATIAALASATMSVAPHRLLLWEPVIDGASYLGELSRAHAAALEDAYGSRYATDDGLKQQFAREAGQEALGFPITDSLRREISSLVPDSIAALKASSVNMFVNAAAGDSTGPALSTGVTTLVQRLDTRNISARNEIIAEPIIWTADEMMNAATVPGEVLQRIAASFNPIAVEALKGVQS
jgi:uncharacterized protein